MFRTTSVKFSLFNEALVIADLHFTELGHILINLPIQKASLFYFMATSCSVLQK